MTSPLPVTPEEREPEFPLLDALANRFGSVKSEWLTVTERLAECSRLRAANAELQREVEAACATGLRLGLPASEIVGRIRRALSGEKE